MLYQLIRSVAYIGVFCLASIALAALIARPAIGLVYGDDYREIAFLLPWYIGAISLLSVSTVIMYFNLSVSSNRHLVPLAGSVGLLIILMVMFHDSPLQIVIDLTISLAVLLVANLAVQTFGSQNIPPAQLRKKGTQKAKA